MRCTGILCAVATVDNSYAKYSGGIFGCDSLSRYFFSRFVARGMQGDARHRLGIYKIKDKRANQPAKKGATPCRSHMLPPVELQIFVTTDFQKCMYMRDVLCSVTERIV